MTTGNVMSGSVSHSPITDIDLSKNGIELLDSKVISKLCKLMTEANTKLGCINLRDNLIRDEPADLISIALKQNLTITKFHIDMNPVKHSIVKEMEQSVKRNVVALKDKEFPAIKQEINVLYEERQKVMDDLPISKKEQFGKTFIETAIHIDEWAKLCEHNKNAYKREFLEDDKKLD